MTTATHTTATQRSVNPTANRDFVTFTVGDHLFGVPVLRVQDILVTDTIAPVPLAPAEVRGSINLRGRIVTVVDVRQRLGLPAMTGERARAMGVTVESGHELYTLLVDEVGDVVNVVADQREPSPSTLDAVWSDVVDGVFRHGDRLLITLDTDRLLNVRSN
jgi:purine-binding chemotaxis protein CheW